MKTAPPPPPRKCVPTEKVVFAQIINHTKIEEKHIQYEIHTSKHTFEMSFPQYCIILTTCPSYSEIRPLPFPEIRPLPSLKSGPSPSLKSGPSPSLKSGPSPSLKAGPSPLSPHPQSYSGPAHSPADHFPVCVCISELKAQQIM